METKTSGSEAAVSWRSRPVFISSTFKDMHVERDYLRTHVFPRLEEELRKRRHTFEPIDLRMGVDSDGAGTDEARELLVLKVCLDEIKRSRPFLLVLLGDRYGWTPPEDRMAAAAREAGFEGDVRGRSVTALEIEYGILKESPDQAHRSFFYFREPLPYDKMPKDVAAIYDDVHSSNEKVRAGHDQLVALKKKLNADPELSPRVHSYAVTWDESTKQVTGLEAFGEMVFQHIWKELEEETRAFASQPPPTWEEQERAALMEFVENRVRNFTGREELLEQMCRLALDEAQTGVSAVQIGACLIGAPGSGKSSVFAELFQRLSADGSALLLANAAGATPRGASVDAMLRRWIQELADALKIKNPLPEKATPDDVDNTFYSLLHRAAGQRRVVVMLDALDQFEETPRSKFMTWFRPRQWPANARIIATSLPDPRADELSQWAGVEELELAALTAKDAEQIARKVWARYHQPFDAAVLRVLTEKKNDGAAAFGNPLWLTLALEQLSLLDADDFARVEREFTGSPSERLRTLKMDIAGRMPPDVQGLYGSLLNWTEKAFGAEHARAFAVAIALSRFGWRESDLLEIVPRLAPLLFPGAAIPVFDDLKLAALRRGFRAHLARRGAAGQLDFFHAQMRRTLAAHVLNDDELVRRLHGAIGDYLETLQENDPMIRLERMRQLIAERNRSRAAAYYATLTAADYVAGEEHGGSTWDLVEWVAAGEAEREGTSSSGTNENLRWLNSWLEEAALQPEQVHRLCSNFLFGISNRLENAVRLGTRALLLTSARTALQHLALSDPTNAGWLRDLSVSHGKIGDVLMDQGDLGGALKAFREGMGVAERLALSDPTNAGWLRDLSVSQEKIGDVLLAHGDLGGALKAFRESLALRERLALSDPTNAGWLRDLSVGYNKIGDVLMDQGDLGGALKAFRESLALRERLALSDPTNAGWQRDLSVSHGKIGVVLLAQGDLGGALKAFREGMVVVERLAVSDSTNAGWQYDLGISHERIGAVLQAQGDLAGALSAFKNKQAIISRLALSDPTNAGWQRDLSVSYINFGDVLRAQGDMGGALKAFREGMGVAERLALSDPTNARWQRDLFVSNTKIGVVLLAQGDLLGALKAFREGMGVAERLALSDPTNAGWQRDLSVSHGKIGDVLLEQGDMGGALKAFREGMGVAERLALSDPTNARWQRDLFVSYWRLAEIAEKNSTGDARACWRKAYEQLSGTKQRGIMLPTDEQYLPVLKKKAGL